MQQRSFLFSSIAEFYQSEDNKECRKNELSDAICSCTEGIKVKCKNDELNAMLHCNRAIAHLFLGKKSFFIFI